MAGPLLNTTGKMAPITIGEQFKDPRAAILYGGGNAKISDNDIRSFINSGKSNDEILRTALQYGVSADQISNAMGGKNGFDSKGISSYLTSQGIDSSKTPGTTIDIGQAVADYIGDLDEIKAERVKPTNVAVNPKTDTVSGQLDSVLDPNSPLMQRAATMGNQQANKRGLLNSSMGIGAAQAAMTDAALQIATPDAQMFSNTKLENARAANQASITNAQNALTAGMFNNDMAFKVGSTNAANQLDASKFNAQNINSLISQYFDIDSRNRLAQLDADTRTALAQLDAKTQGSSNAASLYNNMSQKIMEILASDAPNKEALLTNAYQLLNDGIKLTDFTAGLGLDKMGKLGETPEGTTSAEGKGLLNNSGGSGGTQSSGTVSALTNEPLGPSKLRPELFNTLSGTISATAAETLKNAYQIDPRFIINPFDPDIVGFQYEGTMSIPGATRPSKLGRDKMKALKDGIANGTIAKIPVRDPNYGVLLDPSFAEFDQPDLYYDPNNTLGLVA
jgi:hypothetical protein